MELSQRAAIGVKLNGREKSGKWTYKVWGFTGKKGTLLLLLVCLVVLSIWNKWGEKSANDLVGRITWDNRYGCN